MKELSIEERAQRYDEAIERAKKWYNAPNVDKIPTFGNRVIEEIFPELIKNNDEKIRGAIIHFISHTPTVPKGRIDKKTMLAWLEKQGEQKPADKVEPKDYNSIDPHFGKPADKVEPKFQNGQWIVWQDKCYKVNYNGCGYELIDQNGLSTSLEYGTIDENAHLWDITKDAKDGDVLVASDGSIFIFKEVDDNVRSCKHYIALTSDKVIKVNVGLKHYWETARAVHPSTKEQRDTLEKAMADAGYTFDFEKKELKKISQRMISAEAKEAMYGKPTTWSEEDSTYYDDICEILINLMHSETAKINKNAVQKDLDWLVSIKDRVGCETDCTTMWKPSDEQMDTLRHVISGCSYDIEPLVEMEEQLKKLRGE